MKIIYSILLVLILGNGVAQPFSFEMPIIPVIRQSSHDNIDKSQQQILALNCKRDSVFLASNNLDVNLYITAQLKNKVDFLQYYVETAIDGNDRYRWLRGINDMLQDFIKSYQQKRIDGIYLCDLINAYYNAMVLQLASQSIEPVIEANVLEVGTALLSNFALQTNIGVANSKLILIYKLCKQDPQSTLKILSKYPNLKGADSLIIDFAYLNPQELYDYAASDNELGKRIRSINEPMVSTIVQMANTNDGRFLFPFLDEIMAKKISADEVKNTIDNPDAYYKLLVKTLDFYETQKQQGKKPLAMDVLTEKLKAKALENYITPINALHDENNAAIRFAAIKNLTPTELYFITVMGEEELYTSSFINGVYPKMIEGLGKIKTDSLFRMVHYSYYRKFLKMCASFNMLEDFLAKMDKIVAENLMKTFASDLEQYWSLEETVDVADSYSSIKDVAIKKIINDQVKLNLQRNTTYNNTKGKVIYGLLNQIFSSFDSSGNINAAKLFNVPSVYQLAMASLKDANGRINVQQFFYGDKDGKDFFNEFVNSFRSNGWRVQSKPNWVEVSTSKGATPITIYANRPLNEDEGLDDAAQKNLYDYLDSLSIYPTIAIHRGHSYYVKSSLKQITSYAKLVLLGSCGGYHSLSKVLATSPQAQIIASKQIGTGLINIAMIDIIMETLKQGKDLNWQNIWKYLENKFISRKELKERFDDYIPPHKNLGAIFIMTYHKAMEEAK
jgi:hypothetical protein